MGDGFCHFFYVGVVRVNAVGDGLQKGADCAGLFADVFVAIDVVFGLSRVDEYFPVFQGFRVVVCEDRLFENLRFFLEMARHGCFVVHANASREVWPRKVGVDFYGCIWLFAEEILPQCFGFSGRAFAFYEVVNSEFWHFAHGIGYAASFADAVGVCDGHEAELYVV